MVSSVSFQGITTGLQTDKLVDAMISQDGRFVQRLKDRQTANTNKATAIKDIRQGIDTLAVKFSAVSDALKGTDKTAATTAMQNAIDAYNNVIKTYKSNTAVSKDSNDNLIKGALSGDTTIQNVIFSLRSTAHQESAASGTNDPKRLSDVGIKTNADGTLSLDSITFQAAFTNNQTGLQNLITGTDSSKGLSKQIQTFAYNNTGYNGQLEQIRSSIDAQNKNLSDQIAHGQSILDKRRVALKSQFDHMESVISQLRSASASLTGLGNGTLF